MLMLMLTGDIAHRFHLCGRIPASVLSRYRLDDVRLYHRFHLRHGVVCDARPQRHPGWLSDGHSHHRCKTNSMLRPLKALIVLIVLMVSLSLPA